MLVPGEIRKYIQIPFKWGQYFYTLPFVWDNDLQCVKLATSKRQLAGFYTWCACAVIGQALMFIRFILDLKSVEKRVNMQLFMMLFNFGTFVQYEICLLMVYKQVPVVVNTFMRYFEYFEVTYSNRKRIYRDVTKLLQQKLPPLVLYGFHFCNVIALGYVVFSSHHLKFLRRAFLLEWMLGEGYIVSEVQVDGVLLALALGVWTDIFASTFMYFWALIAVLGSYLQVIVRDMAPEGKKRNYWTRESLRRPGCFCMVSKHVLILIDTLMEVARPIFLVIPADLIMVMTLWAFHLLKATDSVIRIGAIVALIIILSLFAALNAFGGRTSECFKHNLDEFLRRAHCPYAIRVVKGIRIPYFRPYGIFVVGNQLTISGIQTVLDNVISLIAI